MNRLIVESYTNTTLNTILDDISKKQKIDTTKDRVDKDIPIEEIKFKYRTYSECVKMLYKSAGVVNAIQVLTFINFIWPVVQTSEDSSCSCNNFLALSSGNFSVEIYPHFSQITMQLQPTKQFHYSYRPLIFILYARIQG